MVSNSAFSAEKLEFCFFCDEFNTISIKADFSAPIYLFFHFFSFIYIIFHFLSYMLIFCFPHFVYPPFCFYPLLKKVQILHCPFWKCQFLHFQVLKCHYLQNMWYFLQIIHFKSIKILNFFVLCDLFHGFHFHCKPPKWLDYVLSVIKTAKSTKCVLSIHSVLKG